MKHVKNVEEFAGTIVRLWAFGKMLYRLWDRGLVVAVLDTEDKPLHLITRESL